MSLAGPLANVLIAGLIALLLLVPGVRTGAAGPALSFLALLQVTAVVFNLIPLPPLDGYGAIEPYLGDRVRRAVVPYQHYAFIGLLVILWTVPVVSALFWTAVFEVAALAGVRQPDVAEGYRLFRFWSGP